MRDRSGAARLTSCALALGAALSAIEARADDAPRAATAPPAPSALVPPRALETGRVPYPTGGTGEAAVVVELVVDAEGRVIDARAVDGREPFRAAAIDAATAFRFEPARRGDVTVAARVRVRVAFTPPEVASAPGAIAPASPASPAPPPPKPEEVRVRGARREAGAVSLGGGEVRQIPGAFGDPFRAVEALPGVTPIASGLPFFFVRGAPPGNTGYFVDGVRVPILYHLGLGPSVVHPGLIDRVDFYPGAFPARFGRFAGGVLAGETLPPATRLHGEASVRLFDAGALIESPLDGGRGSVLAGGRYSYTAALLSLAAPDTKLSYWDYQARATWQLGADDRIGVFAFGSYDYLGQRNADDGSVRDLFATQFHRVDLRYDHALGKHGTMRLAATLGADKTGNDSGTVGDTLAGLRLEIDDRITDEARVRAGADAIFDHYSLAQSNNPDQVLAQLLYPPRDEALLGAYADVVWRPAPRVEIVPGVRTDLFASHRLDHPPIRLSAFDPGHTGLTHTVTESAIPAVDPRLAARVTVARNVTWISSFGVSHQKPSFFVPLPGLQIGELKPSLQTSYQTGQGIELQLPAEITATATAFLHDYLGLNDLTATCPGGGGTDARALCVDDRVRGRTFGAELLVRRALTKRVTGWLAYTLSRSTREAHVVGARGDSLQTIPGEFDRTHVLNAVAAYDLGRGWRAGGRFVFYTGRPYSLTSGTYPIAPYNGYRLPPFYRIDLRLEKRWRIGERAGIALVFEGLNVTLHKEAVGITCTQTTGPVDRCVPDEIGPVTIPSIGVEAFY